MPDPDRPPPFSSTNRTHRRIREDVDRELRFDLDMRTADLVREGLDEAGARQRAVAEFGDLDTTRRYCTEADLAGERARRRAEWLADARRDVGLAWRGLRRRPLFAFVVLVTLALGIGANTAVFSVVRRVLIDRLPYHEPQRLVRLYGGSTGVPDARQMLSASEISVLGASPALAGVGAFGNFRGVTWVGDASAELWSAVEVGPRFFQVLGARAWLGRGIDARDSGPRAVPVVVLSHGVWLRAFGGDAGVVGTDVSLNGAAVTVVGVLPPSFVSPARNPEVWLPLDLEGMLRDRTGAARWGILRAVGRVADGVTPSGLDEALTASARRLRDYDPGLRGVAPANAVPLRDAMVGNVRQILLAVMGAAVLVLLLCCVNVAGLFLSRAAARGRELAVRAALGAGRARLVRQLLTESALVAVLGGCLGVVMAFWLNDALATLAALELPALRDAPIDGAVLAFAAALSLLSALAFGLAPALASVRSSLREGLAESTRTASGGRSRWALGRVLVAVQVALAVVLLIGGGLLGRTLAGLQRAGLGFETSASVLTFGVSLAPERYDDPRPRLAFMDAFTRSLDALPDVVAVGAVTVAPWNGYTSFGPDSLLIEDAPAVGGGVVMAARVRVSDDYFRALGIPLRRGRAFTASDVEGAPPVAIVSEGLAARIGSGAESVVGSRVRFGGGDGELARVVGVVGDVRAGPGQDPPPTLYVPVRQHPVGAASFVVRVSGNAEALLPAIRRVLRRVDPALPMSRPRTTRQLFGGMLSGRWLPLLFTGSFAVLALLLAALGVYGVQEQAVSERRRELAIRVSLGAGRATVLALVVRQGMAMAAVGASVGLLVAALLTPMLAGLLVGVTPHDALTFAAIPLVLLGVSAVACLVPALRALRLRPVEVLRGE